MERGRSGFARIVVALLLGTFSIFACASRQELPPTGAYKVEEREYRLETSRGTHPITTWRPADTTGPLPLILYAPGWGNDRKDSASLNRELASHGYLVVAFDDLSQDEGYAGETDQERMDRHAGFSLENPSAYRTSDALAGRRVAQAAAKGEAILDALLSSPEHSPFIDADRIGFVGYSFGGATGAEQSLEDNRIRAVVNLDGWLFGASEHAPEVPYMLLSVPEDFPPSEWRKSAEPTELAIYEGALKDQRLHRPLMAREDFVWLLAEGMGHAALNDQGLANGGSQTLDFKRSEFAAIRRFLDRFVGDRDEAGGQTAIAGLPGLRAVDRTDLLPATGLVE